MTARVESKSIEMRAVQYSAVQEEGLPCLRRVEVGEEGGWREEKRRRRRDGGLVDEKRWERS